MFLVLTRLCATCAASLSQLRPHILRSLHSSRNHAARYVLHFALSLFFSFLVLVVSPLHLLGAVFRVRSHDNNNRQGLSRQRASVRGVLQGGERVPPGQVRGGLNVLYSSLHFSSSFLFHAHTHNQCTINHTSMTPPRHTTHIVYRAASRVAAQREPTNTRTHIHAHYILSVMVLVEY